MQEPEALAIVFRRSIQLGNPRLAKVDADRDLRVRLRKTASHRLGAVVIESHSIYESLFGRDPKQARFWVA
jgi:hypothetical protein